MKRKPILALAAAGLALSTANAFAQTTNDYRAPWRGDFWGTLGVSAGESKFRTDCHATDVFSCDHRDSAWKVYAGGSLSRILGLEVGYTDFGKVRASGGDTKAWAGNISLTAGVPIGDRFDIFAKGGGIYGRTDVSADPSTLFDRGRKSGWGTTYGVGASFAITPNWLIRADWDRYHMDFVGGRRDVDLASAGVAYRF
ncbi:MAG TPA: outer membrane beta-barrel protein [Usitatibacter sp.]|nr:outer membrane beta-barrel protein [Usitatibacter sp.]